MKRIIFFAITLAFLISCSNKDDKRSEAGISIADTMLHKVGTVPTFPAITDSGKLMVLQRNGKSISYAGYKKLFTEESYNTEMGAQPAFKWLDIDGDGNNEIVTSSYTGGAHCCDVNTILAITGENEMTEVLNFMGGIVISGNSIGLSFSEALGYFHTCYACESDSFYFVPRARFDYKNGKFSHRVNDTLNDIVATNLRSIAAKGIPDIDAADDAGFDDGTRKAVAFNIAAYYFNNNRNIKAAQVLFDRYYTHKDKATIWKDLVKYLEGFNKDIEKAVQLQR